MAMPVKVALLGHSFGGAVVMTAAALHPGVAAVAAMSSQTSGAQSVSQIGRKPLLPATCSRDVSRRATEPKELILYPGCRHGLDQCRDDPDRDLTAWLERSLGLPA